MACRAYLCIRRNDRFALHTVNIFQRCDEFRTRCGSTRSDGRQGGWMRTNRADRPVRENLLTAARTNGWLQPESLNLGGPNSASSTTLHFLRSRLHAFLLQRHGAVSSYVRSRKYPSRCRKSTPFRLHSTLIFFQPRFWFLSAGA